MNLSIETFQRGTSPTFVAVCAPADSLLSAGAVGGGVTERAAIQEAINAYFTKLDNEASSVSIVNNFEPLREQISKQLVGTPGFIQTGPPITGRISFAPQTRRVAVDTWAIKSMLNEAINADPTPKLSMTYSDADGNRTVRDILPSRIEGDRGVFGFRGDGYLIAVDCEKDEPRTFRIDRIEQVEHA